MVDQKKINKIRKKIKEIIEEQSMVINNEPDHSGGSSNTIGKDPEEQEDEKFERNIYRSRRD